MDSLQALLVLVAAGCLVTVNLYIAFGSRRRRAERPGAVGGPHLHVPGQGGQPAQ